MKTTTILAIETSCDETAAAIIKNGKILSSVIASQAKMHSEFGGVVPEVAAREHIPTIMPVVELALKKAQTELNQIDVVAVTQGPGLITSLLVGLDTAKALSFALNKPLLPINHIEAHIYANFVEKMKGKIFPSLILTVSGSHTLLVLMTNHAQYKILGETVDDAAGEAFDKSARLMGLGYPGGRQISEKAKQGDPKKFNLPRPMLNKPGFDFSFSGLKTAVLYAYEKQPKKDKQLIADMSASVQQAIVDTLIGKLEKAINKFRPKSLMLGGGVAANDLLRAEFEKLAKKYDLKYAIPKFEYCTDNAAMIGLAAHYRILSGKAKFTKTIQAQPQFMLK